MRTKEPQGGQIPGKHDWVHELTGPVFGRHIRKIVYIFLNTKLNFMHQSVIPRQIFRHKTG